MMKRFNVNRLLLFVSLFTIVIIACKKEEDQFSNLSVRLTDDPAAYDSVIVNIRSVEIHTDASGWQTLSSQAGFYNLLELQNGIDTVLAPNQQVPAGVISQIRLILGEDNRVVESGVSYPLELSSQDKSGLKLNIHQELLPNTTYVLELDFDAAQSINQTGNSTYKLKPVIRATFR